MNTNTVKAKIKNLSGCNFSIHSSGDLKSFTVHCATTDALKIAYAIRRAGWKRTANQQTGNDKNIICFHI